MAIRGPSAKGLDCVSGARVRIPLSPLINMKLHPIHREGLLMELFFLRVLRTACEALTL